MSRLLLQGLLLVLCIVAVGAAAAQESDEPQAGDTRVDAHGIEQVYVPPGCFMMGITAEQAAEIVAQNPPGWVRAELPMEQPQHEVCLSQGYWIDKYEVTIGAFQAFVDDGGYTNLDNWSEAGQDVSELPVACEGDDDPQNPRTCVTWYEAEAYARWRGGALPTEAQWEFAARGPENRIYPWGDEWDTTLANVEDSTGVVPVGSYPGGVSWVGAHDMAGNAMEWVADWWTPNYRAAQRDDPTGPANGRIKPERGGWWGSNSFVARTTFRYYEDPPTYQDHHIGFRIVSPVESE